MAGGVSAEDAVTALLQALEQEGTLSIEELSAVERNKGKLIAADFVSSDILQRKSLQQLEAAGISPGAAEAIKKAFPGASNSETGVAFVHVKKGNKELPTLKQPRNSAGELELLALQQQLGVDLDSVAVENAVCSKPAYKPFRNFNIEVAPN